MKGYGLPRNKDIECPDKNDITHYGLAPSKYGEKRRPSVKNWARRRLKKIERMNQKIKLKKEIEVINE